MPNDLIENYNKALQAIYDHVGFIEDWVFYAIDDRTEMYWKVLEREVIYSEDKKSIIKENGNYIVNKIYTQRFYNKYIYRGKELTMIFVDTKTETDGNKFFAIFDNDKEIKENEL